MSNEVAPSIKSGCTGDMCCMKTKEQIKEQSSRMICKAYDYYANNVSRRRKFVSLINLLSSRRSHNNTFKHPETTWKECWDYAFKEGCPSAHTK